jgi:isopentenyl-diphosphate Delta-isomerase
MLMPQPLLHQPPLSASTEYVVLVDEKDNAVGIAEKLAAHRDAARHRAVSVFLFCNDGQMLLQRRAVSKYHSGGLWSNACCGHPRPGETPVAAGARRLREEMGLACTLVPAFGFTYRADLGGGLTEHEYDHVFVGYTEDDPSPDPEEVGEWARIDCTALRADVAARPGAYTAWFKLVYAAVLARTGQLAPPLT